MSDNLLKYLDSIDEEAKSARDEKGQTWPDDLALYKGKHWPEKRAKWKVSPVLNFIMSAIERKVAYMTDTRPTLHVVARHDELQPTAEILQGTIQALWDEKDWQSSLAELIYFACIFNSSFASCVWDNSADFGYGDIEIPVIDPRAFSFDPFVFRDYNIDKGEYIIFESFEVTQELKIKFPDKADSIPSYYEPQEEDTKWKSLIAKVMKRKQEKGFKPAIARSLKKEYYLKDRSVERDPKDEEKILLDALNNPKFLYPGGRHILRSGNAILSDKPNPYIDGVFPVEMLSWHFDPDSAAGISEVQTVKSAQTTFNKLIEIIAESAMLMTNPIWIGDFDALDPESWKNLRNKPGDQVKVRPGKTLKREGAPGLPTYIREMVLYLEGSIDKLTGMVDVTRGRPEGGITSGVAIDSLQSAAQSVIRLKSRKVESFLQRLGQKMIARILQYYTDDRIIHMLGKSKGFDQFKFQREEMLKPLRALYVKGDERVPARYLAKRACRDLKFKIVPGSSLAMTKMPKIMLAITLYKLGVIDEEALLETLDYPGREEILQRTAGKPKGGKPSRRAEIPPGLKEPPEEGGGVGEAEEVTV